MRLGKSMSEPSVPDTSRRNRICKKNVNTDKILFITGLRLALNWKDKIQGLLTIVIRQRNDIDPN